MNECHTAFDDSDMTGGRCCCCCSREPADSCCGCCSWAERTSATTDSRAARASPCEDAPPGVAVAAAAAAAAAGGWQLPVAESSWPTDQQLPLAAGAQVPATYSHQQPTPPHDSESAKQAKGMEARESCFKHCSHPPLLAHASRVHQCCCFTTHAATYNTTTTTWPTCCIPPADTVTDTFGKQCF